MFLTDFLWNCLAANRVRRPDNSSLPKKIARAIKSAFDERRVIKMINILVHGLGQDNHSWDNTNKYLRENEIDVICPNLFEITKNTSKDYKMMYNTFSCFCNNQKEQLNLCGLSLGGVLVLDFVKEYPEKVNSIILIGTPYKIPRGLCKLQNIVYHIMPKSAFEKIGCPKNEFISLLHSLSNLNISRELDKINCPSLILCGAKDKVNMKNVKLLNNDIKNSKFKIIENAGHEVNTDNPKELAHAIYNFWKDKKCFA